MINNLLKVIKILFALFSFITVFYTILELTYFLSYPINNLKNDFKNTPKDPWLRSSKAMLINMGLLTLFIIQHSFMASQRFKNIINKIQLTDASRCLYVTATAGVTWVLIKYWQIIPDVVLWNIDLKYKPIFWLYCGIHVTAWVIIYVANICFDITELLGLKQIYYSLVNLPDPHKKKSYQLQKLMRHMRHPSFLGFIMVFWFYPIMTLDRALLATILTSYMYIAWNTDGEDYNYQKYMYQRKYYELERLNTSY